MNREWLEDYGAREEEEYEKFKKDLLDRKLPPNSAYPPKHRFIKLQEPLSHLCIQNIWSQIPLYGSSILPLIVRTKEDFFRVYGLNTKDIDNMVDLAKTTGRVQFILPTISTDYVGLDFLDPIFKELKPPQVCTLPLEIFDSLANLKKYEAEFYAIAKVKWIPFLNKLYSSYLSLPRSYVEKRIRDYVHDYLIMKALGYHEIAELMLNLMIDDISEAWALFDIVGNLIAAPLTNPMGPYGIVYNLVREELIAAENRINKYYPILPVRSSSELTLPYEIGRFLMQKLTYLPESYEACLAIIERYKQEDMYNLMSAIQEGSKENDADKINSKGKELSTVFDNLWKDADRISKLSEGISYGFTFYFGLLGWLVTQPIGGIGGILAGLGFKVLDKAFGPSLSEEIAKRVYPNHLVAIHDFKQKHKISSR